MGENLWQYTTPSDPPRSGDVSPAYFAYRQFVDNPFPYKQVCTYTDIPLDTNLSVDVVFPNAILAGTQSWNRQGCSIHNISLTLSWFIRRVSEAGASSDFMRIMVIYTDIPTPSVIEYKRLTEGFSFGGTPMAWGILPPPTNYVSGNFVIFDKVVYLPLNRIGGTGAVNFNTFLPNDNMSGVEYIDLRGFTTNYYGPLINALPSTGTIAIFVGNARAGPASFSCGLATSLIFAD